MTRPTLGIGMILSNVVEDRFSILLGNWISGGARKDRNHLLRPTLKKERQTCEG